MMAGYKLHYRTTFQGIPVSVENRKGSVRTGIDPGGNKWATKMHVPYGRIPRTKGMDGEPIDVFIGPHKDATHAHVVQVMKPPHFRDRDEEKAFLGFKSPEDAVRCFRQHYDDPKFFGGVKSVPMGEFKNKTMGGDGQPTRLAAAMALYGWGEANWSGTANMAHIEPIPTVHPPSLKHPQRIPVDAPWERDDRFGDVTRRRKAEKFRFELMRRHGPGQRDLSVRTTSIGWQPVAVTVGV